MTKPITRFPTPEHTARPGLSRWRAGFGCGSGLGLILLLALAGCSGQEATWHGTRLDGLMPPLAFELTDTQGRTVTASDSAGQLRLLFFGYTSCPDVCPTTLADLQGALRALPEAQRARYRVLFVSVDPNRDTPARLAAYTGAFGPGIQGLTGTDAQLRALARRYRTTFGYGDADAAGQYEVSHSSAVYAFDGQGKARLLLQPARLGSKALQEDLATLARR
ncbi:SCO family protein [Marinobacter sp. C2H3]|uniref:SCO family protein n=1 Tax=Marinobacter sp. C2H3 TaxID=3119003 RepID=UPI00300F1B22